MDVAILAAWSALLADECICGRPRAVHEHETEDDYTTYTDECPAMAALDFAQAARSLDDEKVLSPLRDKVQAGQATRMERIRARLNPERSRSWWVRRKDELPPA